MIRIALPLLFLCCSASALAQIYPVLSDRERIGLEGPVEQAIDVTRTYTAAVERWEPLVVTNVRTFNREGNLLKHGIYTSREAASKQLFVFDEESDSLRPVVEAGFGEGDPNVKHPISETLYAYEEKGRLAGTVERNYQQGSTIRSQYTYQEDLLSAIVSRDSASGSIVRIEFFHYQKDGRPSGSTIRRFDPATDNIGTLSDTGSVPESRTYREYTSYIYSDTLTPVIYWHWEYGNDSIVDRQTVKRYLDNGMLSASTSQIMDGAKVKTSHTQIFNAYGDALSTSNSIGQEKTYERTLDYIYDELDSHRNWTVKRQFVDAKKEGEENEDKILITRTDRELSYR